MLQMVVAGMLTRPLETISNRRKKMKKNMLETAKENAKLEEGRKKAQGVMRKECTETTEMNEVFFEKQNGDIPEKDIDEYAQNPVVRKPQSLQ